MSEDYLIRNCAPTLAKLKTANLFSCPYKNKSEVVEALCSLNRKLSRKGLRILPLRFSEDKALIYLYRPNLLAADLCHSEAIRILNPMGYSNQHHAAVVLTKALIVGEYTVRPGGIDPYITVNRRACNPYAASENIL